jgi:RpiB/LacA/LacB family sugar-phosphate isomerase
MSIYIGSDHGGFRLKGQLITYLTAKGFTVTDLGNKALDKTDDYPAFAANVARQVQLNKNNRGILICRNGVGVSIAANKFNDIRAVLSTTPRHASSSRFDDDTNVICLGQDYLTSTQAKKIVTAWLDQSFSNGARHKRRLDKITKIERSKR